MYVVKSLINSESKFRELDFIKMPNNKVEINITPNPNELQNGTYMLFVINSNGVPSTGKIVYLKSSFQGILDRINACPNADKKLKKRPLLQNLNEAIKLYDSRVSDYERVSDIVINVEQRDLKDIVEEILGQI